MAEIISFSLMDEVISEYRVEKLFKFLAQLRQIQKTLFCRGADENQRANSKNQEKFFLEFEEILFLDLLNVVFEQ